MRQLGVILFLFLEGVEKKTARDVWNVFPQLTQVLKVLKALPQEITEECMAVLEKFVVLTYDRKAALRK